MSLNRSLNLTMLTFYGLGMILGAGIYSIIGQAAGRGGEGVWHGFLFAAIAALLTALSYAELATMYPKAGGEYVYLKETFPNQTWIATFIGLMMSFAGCATATTVSLAFSSYLQHFIKAPHFLVAGLLVLLCTGINLIGVKESSRLNAIFTSIEVFGLILFIGLGFANPQFGEALAVAPTTKSLSAAALIIFAYFGFENIVNLSEETKDPEKNIPRAIILSLLISTVLYLLVSLAAVALMPVDQLASTEKALTDAAMKHSPRIAGILGGIALFATANTALISLVTTSRILYGISKENSLPKVLSRTSKRKIPWVAALATFVVTVSLLPLGKVETVASLSSFATLIAFVAVNVALIILRYTQPHRKRPFKVPLSFGSFPILPALGIVVCSLFLFVFVSENG